MLRHALYTVLGGSVSHCAGRRLAVQALRAISSQSAAEPLVTTSTHEGGVTVLTLNDPKRLNALTVDMGEAFQRALDLDYSKTNALVITGSGRAFSAGGDLNFLQARSKDTPSRNAKIMRDFYERFAISLRRDVPVPVLAAINGPAIGAGLCLALAADLRIAARQAQLGITFVGIGLHPGMLATHYLPTLVGPQLAARLCLTGETVTGEEAARMGLVLEAVEGDQVLPRTLELAKKIASNAPIAVRTCTRTLRMAADEGMDRAAWREADAQAQCYAGADLAEGVAAIAAKRKPVWAQYEHYRE